MAYALIFVSWVLGPLAIYFGSRDGNKFVAFHALYATYIVTLAPLLVVITIILASITRLANALQLSDIIFWLGFTFTLLLIPLALLYGFIACIVGKTPLLFAGI